MSGEIPKSSAALEGLYPSSLVFQGGLPTPTAINYLAAVNALVASSAPGSPFTRLPALTFSYGRALQGEPMKCWVKGDEEGVKRELMKGAKACWHAARGEVL